MEISGKDQQAVFSHPVILFVFAGAYPDYPSGIYAANVAVFKRQTVDKIGSNLISSSKAIDNVLRTTEQTGMNFLINDTVQRYLVPYQQQSVDEKEKITSIVKWLASNPARIRSGRDFCVNIYKDSRENRVAAEGGL